VYDLAAVFAATSTSRLILDVLHLGSEREAVDFDQVKNFTENGGNPNPTYGQPTRFQPPMAVRLGLEVGF
jgi:hypothetical protein